jgi:hypothetical protein
MKPTTHTQKVTLLTVYDNMEKSGKKDVLREKFKRNPYQYTKSEVKNNERSV